MEKFIRWLVNALVRMVAKVEVHGYENIPGKGGFIIATNHLGIIDAPMANYVLGSLNLFVPVAEKWEENPIFRWLGKPLNLVFIDRFNLDMKAMREILRRMNEGQTLVIAPEGTRSRNEKMAEGKPGVAYLAARYGWPIMPVALSGTEDRVLFNNLKHLRRTHVTIRAGEVFKLPPLPREGRDAFLRQNTDEIMVRIAAMLPERNRGVYADHPRMKELLAKA
ncbi:MAG TPA: lysophospholipid acyltransferase family protein [Anaerolineales bacterium]